MASKVRQSMDTTAAGDPSITEHRVTDMHVIAWALTVIAFGTIWVAFQVTLIASNF
jgi:hypothetical protein